MWKEHLQSFVFTQISDFTKPHMMKTAAALLTLALVVSFEIHKYTNNRNFAHLHKKCVCVCVWHCTHTHTLTHVLLQLKSCSPQDRKTDQDSQATKSFVMFTFSSALFNMVSMHLEKPIFPHHFSQVSPTSSLKGSFGWWWPSLGLSCSVGPPPNKLLHYDITSKMSQVFYGITQSTTFCLIIYKL